MSSVTSARGTKSLEGSINPSNLYETSLSRKQQIDVGNCNVHRSVISCKHLVTQFSNDRVIYDIVVSERLSTKEMADQMTPMK
jgi:hypothetical protein